MLGGGDMIGGGKKEEILLDGLSRFAKALFKFFSREDVQKIIMGLVKTGVVVLSKHGETIASKIAKGVMGGRRLGETNEVMLSAGRVLSSQERAMQLEARAALPFVQDDPESRLMLEKLKDLYDRELDLQISQPSLYKPKEYKKIMKELSAKLEDVETRIERAEKDADLVRRPAIRDMLAAEEVTKIRDKIAMAEGRIRGDKKAEKKRRKRTAKMKAWTDFTKGIREGEVKLFPGNGFEYTRLKGKVRKLKPE